MEERTCDIIVLGGGPAGMTAAIYAKRANLDVVLLETNVTGGLVNSTYTVENFPSYPEIHGMELMEKMREHVDHMGVEVEEVFEVTGLELGEDEKAVHGDGIVYKAPAIILATGRKPIALDVPTECDQMHFCAICDGAPYKGKRVLVVGGGNSAFDEGLYLLNLGVAELTVVEIMDRFFAAEATQDALLGDPRAEGLQDDQGRGRGSHGRQAVRRHPRKRADRRTHRAARGRDFRLPRPVPEQRMVQGCDRPR